MNKNLIISISICIFTLSSTPAQSALPNCDYIYDVVKLSFLAHHQNLPLESTLKSVQKMDKTAYGANPASPESIDDLVKATYKKPKFQTEGFMLEGVERYAAMQRSNCMASNKLNAPKKAVKTKAQKIQEVRSRKNRSDKQNRK